jgi:hypothetical protein
MELENCKPGESWGCRFKTTTFLDTDGTPVRAKDLHLGQSHPGKPGVYESIGVIQIRDLENGRVRLVDTATQFEFVVDRENIWDIDTVEWVDNEQQQ